MLAFVGNGDVLYWQITDAAKVDNETIVSFVEPYGTYEEELPSGDMYIGYNVAARVKVTGGNLSESVYLPLYFGDGISEDGEFGVDFSPNNGRYWGCGVPTGNQSPLDGVGYGSEMFMECAFQVELGEITWDEVADTLDWTTIAKSDTFAASQLSQYIHERFDIAPPNLDIWTPMVFHTIPEPNSGLLLLFGLAPLLLTRKRSI